MTKLPGYAKYLIVLAAIVLTAYVLIVAKSILSPLLTALILALLLHPFGSWLERLKIPRGISSVLSIVFVVLVIAGLFYFFSAQVRNIGSDLNTIEAKFNQVIDQSSAWMESTIGIAPQEQTNYLKDSITSLLRGSTSFLSRTVSATAGFFTAFFLAMISLFFFLYYRKFFLDFLYRLFSPANHSVVGETVVKIEKVVRSYILGLFTVILIVGVLNTTGLMILGIEHAVFFGALAAVLTIIPYIGVFVGSLLPILFALVTKDSIWYPIGVALIFWAVQFLEGNFITPNVVGGRVSINPFAAILALFFGGMIWGAIGMILSIPILAIMKVIFDTVPSMRPYGFLLGNPPDELALESRKMRLKNIGKRFQQSKKAPVKQKA
ncbi:AI-2E family transporter [Tunicatimonas pelagia]|uniref:AI-2E family transporter n=1 Tax=Tunicatimonas pelagia TaxID=931531 RepID=UPI002665DEF0|nr:AI-2E family transporter [Tunicatimonas pelagia]WKN42053.1 AI-2E family transporter [Tunicatimonas pelagia]